MIGLVSCSSQKLDRAAPARELYCSQLFRLSMRYAERYCDLVYIISAKHGLVPPPLVIEPYDLALTSLPIDKRRAWGIDVIRRIEAAHPRSELLVLAGEAYVNALQWGVNAPSANTWITPIRQPLAGMMIGERLGWLSEQLKAEAA